jgi:hypothetical protein
MRQKLLLSLLVSREEFCLNVNERERQQVTTIMDQRKPKRPRSATPTPTKMSASGM